MVCVHNRRCTCTLNKQVVGGYPEYVGLSLRLALSLYLTNCAYATEPLVRIRIYNSSLPPISTEIP